MTPLSTRPSLEVKGGQNALFREGTIREQPHSIGACHGMSLRIRGVQVEFAEKEPGLRATLGPPLKLNMNPEIDCLKSDCRSRSLREHSGNRSPNAASCVNASLDKPWSQGFRR